MCVILLLLLLSKIDKDGFVCLYLVVCLFVGLFKYLYMRVCMHA